MTTEMLEAIWKNPDDRTLLAVYADWLGSTGEATRSEYMQLRLLDAMTQAQQQRMTSLRVAGQGPPLRVDLGRRLGGVRGGWCAGAGPSQSHFAGGNSTPSMMCTMPLPARAEPTINASFTYVFPSFTWNTTLPPFATPSFMPSFMKRVS